MNTANVILNAVGATIGRPQSLIKLIGTVKTAPTSQSKSERYSITVESHKK